MRPRRKWLESFRHDFFAVWDGKSQSPPVEPARRHFEKYLPLPGFGENFQRVDPDFISTLLNQAMLESFPNCSRKAIAVRNSSLRDLPSHLPIFALPPDQPADGYPFDLLQVRPSGPARRCSFATSAATARGCTSAPALPPAG